MLKPEYSQIIGYSRAWSPGTKGMVTGEPILAPIKTEADMEKYKGKLKGKIVLTDEPIPLLPPTDPFFKRYTDAELADNLMAPDPSQRQSSYPTSAGPQPTRGAPTASTSGQPFNREAMRALRNKINEFMIAEGALLTVSQSARLGGGTVFGSAAGSRDVKDPLPPPAVSLSGEQYNRIARLIEKKVPISLEFDIRNTFYEKEQDSFNVIAEIPGSSKADEVVMLGGHLDSEPFGTGATDNASGVAISMEAFRILKTLNVKMARTVRLALWSGEEQGLLGSAAYVAKHFADPEKMELKPEHEKISAYYNLDNGAGKIRGIYLQGNDMLRPVFEAWLAPFKDLGANTVTIRTTGSTDHASFDAVGIPGFQFMQDALDYFSRTHHSNMDTFDRLQAGDMMQASAVMASFVYHTANREELLPRKDLPKPRPRRGGPGGGGATPPTTGN